MNNFSISLKQVIKRLESEKFTIFESKYMMKISCLLCPLCESQTSDK